MIDDANRAKDEQFSRKRTALQTNNRSDKITTYRRLYRTKNPTFDLAVEEQKLIYKLILAASRHILVQFDKTDAGGVVWLAAFNAHLQNCIRSRWFHLNLTADLERAMGHHCQGSLAVFPLFDVRRPHSNGVSTTFSKLESLPVMQVSIWLVTIPPDKFPVVKNVTGLWLSLACLQCEHPESGEILTRINLNLPGKIAGLKQQRQQIVDDPC